MKKTLYLLLSLSLPVLSCHSGGSPRVTVEDPRVLGQWVRAVFMSVVNEGDGGDILTGCSIKEYPEARGEIHDVAGGKMKKLKKVKIPAGETVVLKKGSVHIMVFGLPEDLGDGITLLLHLEKSGTLEVAVPARLEK